MFYSAGFAGYIVLAPKMASRTLALLVFGIGGPLVGGIFVLSEVAASIGVAAFAGLFFAVLAIPPAVAAGGIFLTLASIYVRLFRRPSLNFLPGCALGLLSGYLVMSGLDLAIGQKPHSNFWRLVQAGAFAGGVCGGAFSLMRPSVASSREQGLRLKQIADTAQLNSFGGLDGLHGICPSCKAVIRLSSEACILCDASFDEHSTWQVTPLSPDQLQLCTKALTGQSTGSPKATSDF